MKDAEGRLWSETWRQWGQRLTAETAAPLITPLFMIITWLSHRVLRVWFALNPIMHRMKAVDMHLCLPARALKLPAPLHRGKRGLKRLNS